VEIKLQSWKSMNTFNTLCIDVSIFVTNISLQFDPAPRDGEPQVSRRTPGYHPLLNVTYGRLLPLNAYPYTVEVRIFAWRLLKRGEWKFTGLSYPCCLRKYYVSRLLLDLDLDLVTFSSVALCRVYCWKVDHVIMLYTVVPHKIVKNTNFAPMVQKLSRHYFYIT
jgi:hypothetical protein